jgi:hypothetical protein
MTLTGIIAISGRPGLYKVLAQGKNNIIVQSLVDKKRFPAYASDRISALEDISIYTYSEDKALVDIFDAIYTKEEGKKCISHKESEKKLSEYLLEILPDYDQERVYPSDVKKLFQWFNLLHDAGELKQEKEEKVEDAKEGDADTKEAKPKAAAKKAPAKTKTVGSNKNPGAKTKAVTKRPASAMKTAPKKTTGK